MSTLHFPRTNALPSSRPALTSLLFSTPQKARYLLSLNIRLST
jgi:hypothetical protein